MRIDARARSTTETRRTRRRTEDLAQENRVSAAVIGAAIQVHRTLGPGLLESVYEDALCIELADRGLPCVRQKVVPLTYRGHSLSACLRLDLLVADRVIVEVKACEALAPIHEAQLLTYLRLTGVRVGLLINFNVVLLREGLRRRAL